MYYRNIAGLGTTRLIRGEEEPYDPSEPSEVIRIPETVITLPAPPASEAPPTTTTVPTTEKETWYPESMEAVDTMFTNLFNKLGIGDQSAAEAEDAARAEAAAATAGTSAAAPAPPPAETTPRTVPPTPWYQEYAPHMILGGLGLGAAVVLVLAIRKKKEPAPW